MESSPQAYFSYPSQLSTKASFTFSRRSSQSTCGPAGLLNHDHVLLLVSLTFALVLDEEKTPIQYSRASNSSRTAAVNRHFCHQGFLLEEA